MTKRAPSRATSVCESWLIWLIASLIACNVYAAPIFAGSSGLFAKQATGTLSANSNSTRGPILYEFRHDISNLTNDRLFYGLVLGLAGAPLLLKHEDPELNEIWAGDKTADQIFEYGDVIGRKSSHFAAAGIVYGLGKLTHHPNTSNFAADLFRAQILDGVITTSLKLITNRKRPDSSSYSFPSGHTSTSFTTAAMLYRHFGIAVGVPATVLATYVGLSRLQENRHYLSDIVAGAALGGYIGLKVAGRQEKNSAVYITPRVDNGIELTWKF